MQESEIELINSSKQKEQFWNIYWIEQRCSIPSNKNKKGCYHESVAEGENVDIWC